MHGAWVVLKVTRQVQDLELVDMKAFVSFRFLPLGEMQGRITTIGGPMGWQ